MSFVSETLLYNKIIEVNKQKVNYYNECIGLTDYENKELIRSNSIMNLRKRFIIIMQLIRIIEIRLNIKNLSYNNLEWFDFDRDNSYDKYSRKRRLKKMITQYKKLNNINV